MHDTLASHGLWAQGAMCVGAGLGVSVFPVLLWKESSSPARTESTYARQFPRQEC